MKPRLSLLLFVAALLLVFGATAPACGEDGGGLSEDEGKGVKLSLEEYLLRIDAIFEDADEQGKVVIDELQEARASASTDEERIEAFRIFFYASGTSGIVADFIDSLQNIDPPAEAEQAHGEFLAPSIAAAELSEHFADRLADVQSASELQEVTDEFTAEIIEVASPTIPACFELQRLADDNNIEVDLGCG